MNPDKYIILRKMARDIRQRNNINAELNVKRRESTGAQQNIKRRMHASTQRNTKRAKTQSNTFSAPDKTLIVPGNVLTVPAHTGFNNNLFPIDVLQCIFSFLTIKDVLLMSLVCIVWKKGAEANFRERGVGFLHRAVSRTSYEKLSFFFNKKSIRFCR